MRAKKSVVGRYAGMTADDLRSETAEFDKEMVVAESKPLTAEERAALHKSADAVRELVNVIKV